MKKFNYLKGWALLIMHAGYQAPAMMKSWIILILMVKIRTLFQYP